MTRETDRRTEGPDEIARLISAAGPRREPSAQIGNSVRAAVEQAWKESVGRRRGRRRALSWAAAAASLAMITAGLLSFALLRHSAAIPAAAMLLATRGSVTVATKQASQIIVAGSHLPVGTRVRTAKEGFVLLTVASESVRIGPDSRVRIGGGAQLRLLRGRMYVETTDNGHVGSALIVNTPFGRISHLGTQFQVVVNPTSMAVSVRSGHVRVNESNGRRQRLAIGQGLEVTRGGGIRRITVQPYGASWAWADSLVPVFPIDGRPLSDFLAWYTYEMGLKLVMVGPGTAAAARHTLLSGSISGLTPNQALATVMASTRFEYNEHVRGELQVRMRAHAGTRAN